MDVHAYENSSCFISSSCPFDSSGCWLTACQIQEVEWRSFQLLQGKGTFCDSKSTKGKFIIF